MTRREIREEIFKMLFRVEFHEGEEVTEQLRYVPEEENGDVDQDYAYIQHKLDDISLKMNEIDAMINGVSKGWKTTRMGKVDLTLIRLAVYEIKFEEEIPTGVAINEAVELAKKYGTDNSSAFINGILAKIA